MQAVEKLKPESTSADAGMSSFCWGESQGWVMLAGLGDKQETHQKQTGRSKSLLPSQTPSFPVELLSTEPKREPDGRTEAPAPAPALQSREQQRGFETEKQ